MQSLSPKPLKIFIWLFIWEHLLVCVGGLESSIVINVIVAVTYDVVISKQFDDDDLIEINSLVKTHNSLNYFLF